MSSKFDRAAFARELLFALSVIVVFTAAAVAGYLAWERTIVDARLETGEAARLTRVMQATGRDFEAALGDLRYLAGLSEIHAVLAGSGALPRQELEHEWRRFAEAKALYDQLRLLDARGQEVLRINHDRQGAAYVVPQAGLQDKSASESFSNAIGLDAGGVYVSPLDLNVERGAVEVPYKPTLRFAMPVILDGERRGVVVLNYYGERIIGAAREQWNDSRGEFMLLNADGFLLAAPDAKDEWEFMFGKPSTFAREHPDALHAMQAADQGVVPERGALFIFQAIAPVAEAGRAWDATARGADAGSAARPPAAPQWHAVSFVSARALDDLHHEYRRIAQPLLAAALVVCLPLALYVAVLRTGAHAARREMRLAARVFEQTADAIIVTDAQQRILRTNPALTQLLGYTLSELQGRAPDELTAPDQHEGSFCERIRETASRQGSWQGLVWFRKANGERVPTWTSVSTLRRDGQSVDKCILLLNDITERVREEVRLTSLAETDTLTGLPNRRALTGHLEAAIARAKRHGKLGAILFVDLDRFKAVNDIGGHAAGDQVLRAVAGRLGQAIRQSDIAARVGGDEFVVVLEGLQGNDAAQSVARKITAAVEQPVIYENHAYTVGASIGIKTFSDDAQSAEALLTAADASMYAEKSRRKQVRASEMPSTPAA